MKSIIRIGYSILTVMLLMSSGIIEAKINLGKLISGAAKAYSAYTLSDEDIKAYVHEYVLYSDAHNQIAPANSE